MEFIVSKGKEPIPSSRTEMEQKVWFNIWKRRCWPRNQLLKGDILYWFDKTKNQLVWKTKVTDIINIHYSDKKNIPKLYIDSMSDEYYKSGADIGYIFHYQIKVLEKITVPKPEKHKFDHLGWERLDDKNLKKWFEVGFHEDDTVLDNYSDTNFVEKSLSEQLIKLNERMKEISPERITKLIATTIRKDTKIIKMLKKAANYKCQFPDCYHQIKTEQGGFYIEVAHIEAVKIGGQSILGNLLVLCPNHHKEFDLGRKENIKQKYNKLSGILNGKEFSIDLNYS